MARAHAISLDHYLYGYRIAEQRTLKCRQPLWPIQPQGSCAHPRHGRGFRRRVVCRHALRRVPTRRGARPRTRRRPRAGLHGIHRRRTESFPGQWASRRRQPRRSTEPWFDRKHRRRPNLAHTVDDRRGRFPFPRLPAWTALWTRQRNPIGDGNRRQKDVGATRGGSAPSTSRCHPPSGTASSPRPARACCAASTRLRPSHLSSAHPL
ncbi:Uncharacterised protein [Mycolicibacterium gilvum]|uniref:Uncharacterized protein n=1 Tax=Mycolicibacterium gilvum TaxID=1804 RepID=A0A378SNN7_9MYCO|nr:Uncharacterised protein [Mycolicibacterium gilvum]